MRVLVTGHDGYIGVVLTPLLRSAGHEVVGLDSFYFGDCEFGSTDPASAIPSIRCDVRDASPEHLEGFDAVIHLAALSNDPLGDLNPDCTFDINHRGSVHLAEVAKQVGVARFLHSSTCSLYGAHGDDYIDESAAFLPVTPYGEAKVRAEKDILALADDSFSPTFLRNATAYGLSHRLRGDLVVNNLTGYACASGEVFLKSDGTPWRPLVHIEDISRAFVAALEAPLDHVHGEAFNVGSTAENYKIRDVATIVEEEVEGSRVVFAESAGPDLRNYRVNCDKLVERLPAAAPRWTVRDGVRQLVTAYRSLALSLEDLTGPRLQRIAHVRELLESGALDSDLRWRLDHAATVPGGEDAA